MRLKQIEIDVIKNSLDKIVKDVKVYLFGSRTDDSKKGGDIDLLFVSNKITKKDLRKFRIEFFKVFGEQKLDIVIDDGSFTKIFNKIIYKNAILL